MIRTFKDMLGDENGASLVEYALLVALIAIVALIAVQLLGTKSSAVLSNAATSV